jgi:hypothetical protein
MANDGVYAADGEDLIAIGRLGFEAHDIDDEGFICAGVPGV